MSRHNPDQGPELRSGGAPDTGAAERPLYQIVLRPYRSLSARGFRILMSFIIGASVLASVPFYVMGAWPVIGFFGLDVVLLYWAFQWSYRTARAREEVRVTPIELTVRKISHWGRSAEWHFNPVWVRVHREDDEEFGLTRFALVDRGNMLDLGGFLGPNERAKFASDFTAALAEAKRGPVFA